MQNTEKFKSPLWGRLTDYEREKRDAAEMPACKPEIGQRFVYVVKCNEFVKIGIASDMNKRLSTLQVGCPYRLIVLKHWLCDQPEVAEECLHANFEKYRRLGEWFELPTSLLDWLVALPDLSGFS